MHISAHQIKMPFDMHIHRVIADLYSIGHRNGTCREDIIFSETVAAECRRIKFQSPKSVYPNWTQQSYQKDDFKFLGCNHWFITCLCSIGWWVMSWVAHLWHCCSRCFLRTIDIEPNCFREFRNSFLLSFIYAQTIVPFDQTLLVATFTWTYFEHWTCSIGFH